MPPEDNEEHEEHSSPASRTPGSNLSVSAGLGWRILGRVLDAVLVGLAYSILAAVVGLPPPTLGLGGVEAWTASALTAAIWLLYYVAAESQWGTTVGKRIVGLRVAGPDWARPSVASAAIRNGWIVFGLIPLVGGLVQLVAVIVIAVTIARSEANRGIHDRLAGTTVLRG